MFVCIIYSNAFLGYDQASMHWIRIIIELFIRPKISFGEMNLNRVGRLLCSIELKAITTFLFQYPFEHHLQRHKISKY